MENVRVPLEILRLILRQMVEVLPIKELLRARLVCYEFANELDPLIPYSPHLEDDNLVYKQWSKFPHKRTFIQRKLDQRASEPFFFATVVDDVLQHPSSIALSAKERDDLVSGLIDTVLCSTSRAKDLFSWKPAPAFQRLHMIKRSALLNHTPLPSGLHTKPYEPLESTIFISRATSAIVRNHAAELGRLMDHNKQKNVSFSERSNRLSVCPLVIAAQLGSRDIISVLTDRRYPLGLAFLAEDANAVVVAARNNNLAALAAWMENPSYDFTYDGRIETSTRKEVWRVLDEPIRNDDWARIKFLAPAYSDSEAFPRILSKVAEYGAVEIAKWCLARPDARVYSSKPGRKGPLWLAIQDCWRKPHRHTVLELLLEFGFDPNERQPGVRNRKTLLHAAIKDRDVESARLLVEYGADVNANAHGHRPLPEREYKDKNKSPLAVAFKSYPAITRLLLENGARRRWWWKGQEHVLREDRRGIEHITRVFLDLGFSEQDMYEPVDCYVIVDP
ncbi:hypothetical protein BJY01DRAFT_255036 [Aspergillus pseudoustus]|uniref:Ankyrin repeat-containing domain protein n=1 Tax=Aspergillus pseudoustus TaxID=1810923 RepID=A0ABR4INN8_9EURO